jgi:superfamily I DNA/RNA helicase
VAKAISPKDKKIRDLEVGLINNGFAMAENTRKRKNWTIHDLKTIKPLNEPQRAMFEAYFQDFHIIANGSAGTGKTIVALHRAVHLARENPDSRVLLTTFSETLANALAGKLRCLINGEPRLAERLDVESVNSVGERLYKVHVGEPKLASINDIQVLLSEASANIEDFRFSSRFLLGEWNDVVDAWQLASWEDYRDVKRLGRKTRLPEAQRARLWQVFTAVKAGLAQKGLQTRLIC